MTARSLRLACSSVLLMLSATTRVPAQANQARVISSQPGWSADGSPVRRGRALAPDTLMTGSGQAEVRLACSDGSLHVYRCQKPGCQIAACSTSGRDVAAEATPPAERGVIMAILRSIDQLVAREPREPIIAAARQGGNPNDAVLLLDSRGLHLGPALTRVLEGQYCVKFSPLPEGSAPAISAAVTWNRTVDAEGLLAIGSLRPTLYSLEKGPVKDGACLPDPDGSAAWVLLSSRESFPQDSMGWTEAVRQMAAIETAAGDPFTIRILRHSALAGLASGR